MKVLTANSFGIGLLALRHRILVSKRQYGKAATVCGSAVGQSVSAAPSAVASATDGAQEVPTLQFFMAKLRRASRRNGCLAVQGLRPDAAVHEVRLGQV